MPENSSIDSSWSASNNSTPSSDISATSDSDRAQMQARQERETTAQRLANSPTSEDALLDRNTHSYDEVPSVAVSRYSPNTTNYSFPDTDSSSQLPNNIPNQYTELFGASTNPIGGVDAVWANADGTFSSSDGSTYDPSTGKGTYDPGEDSFAETHRSVGIDLNGEMVQKTDRLRQADRVRTSESLALVEHDPKGLAKTYGNQSAFDYYNNPNMDSIRDEALMQAAAKANTEVSGRYPGENMAYIGIVPLTAHLARSIRLSRPGTIQAELNSQPAVAGTSTRPTWRQSELDVTTNLGPSYRAQVSFKNGAEVPYGTKESVRPDNYKVGESVEVKNYNVETPQGRKQLENNISNQVIQRAQHLPENTQQTVQIDVRGQSVELNDLRTTIDNITDKTNELVTPNEITILR